MIKHLKIACIYVGSIIGAGFASGRELVLFFYPDSFASMVLAAVLLALVCMLFMLVPKNNFIVNLMAIIASILTFVCMLTSINNLEAELSLPKITSILTGIGVSIVALFGVEKIKNINLVLIPIIVVLFIFMAIKAPSIKGEGVRVLNSIKYVGMNSLLGGAVVTKEEKMSLKDKLLSSIYIVIMFIALFYLVYKIAIVYKDSALPVLSFAKEYKLDAIYGICVYFAIVTTLISSAHVVYENTKNILNTKICVGFFVVLSLVFHEPDYKGFSSIIYPILGYMGCVYIVYNLVLIVKRIFSSNDFVKDFNRKIHYCSHKT